MESMKLIKICYTLQYIICAYYLLWRTLRKQCNRNLTIVEKGSPELGKGHVELTSDSSYFCHSFNHFLLPSFFLIFLLVGNLCLNQIAGS